MSLLLHLTCNASLHPPELLRADLDHLLLLAACIQVSGLLASGHPSEHPGERSCCGLVVRGEPGGTGRFRLGNKASWKQRVLLSPTPQFLIWRKRGLANWTSFPPLLLRPLLSPLSFFLVKTGFTENIVYVKMYLFCTKQNPSNTTELHQVTYASLCDKLCMNSLILTLSNWSKWPELGILMNTLFGDFEIFTFSPRGFYVFTLFLGHSKTLCFIISFDFSQKLSCFLSLKVQENVKSAFSVYLSNGEVQC